MDKKLFRNRKELYSFLDTFDWESKRETEFSSVYFLIKNNEYVEPLYFMHFENVYFESPCELHCCNMSDEELREFVYNMYEEEVFDRALEFEKLLQRNGKHYDIDTPQVSPFLEKDFELLDVFSETECLNWLLENIK